MKDDSLAHLHDLRQAAQAAKRFVAGKTFAAYAADDLLRSAVERKLEVMGEALTRIKREDPELLSHIRDYREIISFRNILVHGYDTIDDRIVWGIRSSDLEMLLADVNRLLPS